VELHGSVGGVFAVIGTAETARRCLLAVRRAIRVATLGTDNLPPVVILRSMVPAAVSSLRPTEAKGTGVGEMSLRSGHTLTVLRRQMTAAHRRRAARMCLRGNSRTAETPRSIAPSSRRSGAGDATTSAKTSRVVP